MMRFDVKFDKEGKFIIPKNVMDNVKDKKLVMVFHNGEIRIMPKVMYRNLEIA